MMMTLMRSRFQVQLVACALSFFLVAFAEPAPCGDHRPEDPICLDNVKEGCDNVTLTHYNDWETFRLCGTFNTVTIEPTEELWSENRLDLHCLRCVKGKLRINNLKDRLDEIALPDLGHVGSLEITSDAVNKLLGRVVFPVLSEVAGDVTIGSSDFESTIQRIEIGNPIDFTRVDPLVISGDIQLVGRSAYLSVGQVQYLGFHRIAKVNNLTISKRQIVNHFALIGYRDGLDINAISLSQYFSSMQFLDVSNVISLNALDIDYRGALAPAIRIRTPPSMTGSLNLDSLRIAQQDAIGGINLHKILLPKIGKVGLVDLLEYRGVNFTTRDLRLSTGCREDFLGCDRGYWPPKQHDFVACSDSKMCRCLAIPDCATTSSSSSTSSASSTVSATTTTTTTVSSTSSGSTPLTTTTRTPSATVVTGVGGSSSTTVGTATSEVIQTTKVPVKSAGTSAPSSTVSPKLTMKTVDVTSTSVTSGAESSSSQSKVTTDSSSDATSPTTTTSSSSSQNQGVLKPSGNEDSGTDLAIPLVVISVVLVIIIFGGATAAKRMRRSGPTEDKEVEMQLYEDQQIAEVALTQAERKQFAAATLAIKLGRYSALLHLINKNPKVVQIKDEKGRSLAHICALHANPHNQQDMAQLLTMLGDHGAPMDDYALDHNTPLMFVARTKNHILAEELLKRGANLTSRDETGMTPFMIACAFNCSATLSQLLNKVEVLDDAIVDSKPNGIVSPPDLRDHRGKTALHWAVSTMSIECIKVLMESGKATYQILDENGESPLHLAARTFSPSVVTTLMDKVVGKYCTKFAAIKSIDGQTALALADQIATAKGGSPFVKWFSEHLTSQCEKPTSWGLRQIRKCLEIDSPVLSSSSPVPSPSDSGIDEGTSTGRKRKASPDSISSSSSTRPKEKPSRKEYMRNRRIEERKLTEALEQRVKDLQSTNQALKIQLGAMRKEATNLRADVSGGGVEPMQQDGEDILLFDEASVGAGGSASGFSASLEQEYLSLPLDDHVDPTTFKHDPHSAEMDFGLYDPCSPSSSSGTAVVPDDDNLLDLGLPMDGGGVYRILTMESNI